MANFTAADVKRLREITSAGMMDCKNALTHCDGDFDRAVEELRIKGAKDVDKRAARTTSEGLVAEHGGAMIEINSETDFVAKSEGFITLADRIVTTAAQAHPADLEGLLALSIDSKSVQDLVQEESAKIGEKLQISKYAYLSGQVEVYMHRRAAGLPPQVGVMVQYEGTGNDAQSAAHVAALQIASLGAKWLTRDAVPADIVTAERERAEEIARGEGKPDHIVPKIAEGRLDGFFRENVLVEQKLISDNKKTVQQELDEHHVKVTGFVRFEVGTKA